ncbi:uncharacterized protein TNCV_563671 [Trichonephila clavipes]|nr:uncharacterized protein TNCV_563671 [Trichonephila clavipes]
MADKDILEFVQSSKNINGADSNDKNRMNNAAHVPTSSEIRGILKTLGKRHPRALNGLWKTVQEEWSKICMTVQRKKFIFMKIRARAIAKNHGYQIKANYQKKLVVGKQQIFDDFFQHFWPYIGNNTANVVFQMVKRLWHPHRPMTLHSPTENSLAVLNHKILEANSQVQNVKLGGHQTCLSINRLWHELCDMLRRLVGTTAPGHHDCSIQE